MTTSDLEPMSPLERAQRGGYLADRRSAKLQEDQAKELARQLCPRGFVPGSGYGNGRTCVTCGRSFDEHAVVTQ